MPKSNMFDTRLSIRTTHRSSNTRTKEMFYVFDRTFDGLRNLSNTTKHDQTRPNTTKHDQTRPNTIKHDQTRPNTTKHDQTRPNITNQGVRKLKFLVAKHFPFVQGFRAWTNDKCLATKPHQTLFGDQTC